MAALVEFACWRMNLLVREREKKQIEKRKWRVQKSEQEKSIQ